MVSSSATTPRSGVYYFSQGWKLIRLPGIRRFVFLPLLVNVILMGGAFWWLFTRLDSWIPSLMSHVPEWLQWLNYLLWPVAVISILLVFGYFFSTIANWIAAPFSGLLAEKLETRLTGARQPEFGVFGLLKDVPGIL
ncbi:sulfate transporter CysZ, partial [Klebsiella aerogenes]|uniref:sulfate transporter CysZ n=1 Tax=Klebsiella aerogenes TaxID=548 RepID=UPI00280C7858